MSGTFQAPFFWLLVSALAVLVGAGLLPWDNSVYAERWLPDWLQSVDVQWRIVSTGLCMNFLGVLWLLGIGSGKAETKKIQSDLEVVHSESRAILKQTSRQSAGTCPEQEESFSWMDFCCSTGRTWELGRKIKVGSGLTVQAPAPQSSGTTPMEVRQMNLCGCKMTPPYIPSFVAIVACHPWIDSWLSRSGAWRVGGLFLLLVFRARLRLGSNVPSHWEFMMPNCKDEERTKCGELRERVRHVRGTKDPITMLRFLRARQGSVDSAAKMYETAMRWREGTGYELGFRLNNKDDCCWPPTALLGKDYDGDPIYWNRMGLGNLDFLEQAPAEFLVQHEVYTITRLMQAMEEASRLNNRPIMHFTVVADLGEMSWRSFSNLKGIMKYKVCVRTLEDNFPELVKRIIAIRVPKLAYTLWNIASHFFDEGTRAKIQIADGSHTMKARTRWILSTSQDPGLHPLQVLSEIMDPKWVPEALGGTHRIGNSPWCEPCIPCPRGPPSAETMRSLQAAYDS
eukprot:symbB.v1.2.021990.t2/scaffold1899.1/size238565/26